jgi:RecB family exonuclease
MTKKELILALQKRGVDRVYNKSLTSCSKKELDEFIRTCSEETNRRYFSPSQINCYLRCPMQYYYRYRKGLRSPPGFALTLGSCYDTAANAALEARMEGHDLSADDGIAAFVDDLNVRNEETVWEDGKDRDAAEARGKPLIRQYCESVAPTINPTAVQARTEIELDNRDWSILTVPDVVLEDGILDNKTTGRSPKQAQNALDVSLQMSAYALAWMQIADKDEPGLIGWDTALVRVRKPDIVRLFTNRDESDIRRFLAITQRVVGAVHAGIFTPCMPDSWACSEKFCGYFSECHKDLG